MKAVQIKKVDIVIVGTALFAMFFGAGNLIFPTFIGFSFGDDWYLGFITFSIAGVVFPFLAVIATIKAGGSLQSLGNRVLPKFGDLYALILIVFVALLFVIPRTGATSYEILINPTFPEFSPWLFAALFFAANIYFAIDPKDALDKLGKLLTPALIICLVYMIYKGVFYPIGTPKENSIPLSELLTTSFTTGYQTADALAGLLFTGVLIATFVNKGVRDAKTQRILVSKAAIIAVIGLFLVYSGLSYLGATVSGLYEPDTEKTEIIANLAAQLMGNTTSHLFGIMVTLACLTTATGTTSAAALFFETASRGRASYRVSVISISIFCAVMAVSGVEWLINLAVPVLLICYPVAIVLIICWLFYELLPNDGFFFGAVVSTLLISLIDTLQVLGIETGQLGHLAGMLPLSDLGFGWLILAMICGLFSSLAYPAFASRQSAIGIPGKK